MKKLYYSCKDFQQDCNKLVLKFKKDNYTPKTIIAIARGGLSFAHYLSELLDIRDVFCINSISYEKQQQLSTIKIFNIPTIKEKTDILIVDDICDSGKTLKETTKLLQNKNPLSTIKTATLFYKEGAIFKPDFFVNKANCWIDFFWNKK